MRSPLRVRVVDVRELIKRAPTVKEYRSLREAADAACCGTSTLYTHFAKEGFWVCGDGLVLVPAKKYEPKGSPREKVDAFFEENPLATVREAAKALGISRTTVSRARSVPWALVKMKRPQRKRAQGNPDCHPGRECFECPYPDCRTPGKKTTAEERRMTRCGFYAPKPQRVDDKWLLKGFYRDVLKAKLPEWEAR